jgi:hypothetical protein
MSRCLTICICLYFLGTSEWKCDNDHSEWKYNEHPKNRHSNAINIKFSGGGGSRWSSGLKCQKSVVRIHSPQGRSLVTIARSGEGWFESASKRSETEEQKRKRKKSLIPLIDFTTFADDLAQFEASFSCGFKSTVSPYHCMYYCYYRK